MAASLTLASMSVGSYVDHAAATPSSNAWESIGLTWELFEQLAKPERCLENRRLFMACISGFRSAARSIRGARFDIWPARADDRTEATSKKQWGRVVLGQHRLPAQWRLPASRYAEARRHWDHWEREFGIARKGDLGKDFKSLSEYLRRQISDSKDVSKHTAKALEGFLRSLHDPFARLVPLSSDAAQLDSTGVAHVGIGLELLQLGRAHLIERVITTGPSAAQDVVAGDILIAVDGWTVVGLPTVTVNALLAGPPGSSVRIVRRRSGRDKTLDIRRATFLVPHVKHDVFRAGHRAIGWVNIRSFHSQHVCLQTQQALQHMTKGGVDRLVLDLRGNPGGLLDQAVCVAGLLLGPEVRVARLHSSRTEARYNRVYATAKTAERVYAGAVTVLVDAGSQSAAELLADALRSAMGALIVGQRTFGKGSVQDAMEWAPGVDAAMYREVARYLLRGDRPLHLIGVRPDVAVTQGGRRRVSPATRADLVFWQYLTPPPPASTKKDATVTAPSCQPAPQARWRSQTRVGQLSADPQLFETLNLAASCDRPAAMKGAP